MEHRTWAEATNLQRVCHIRFQKAQKFDLLFYAMETEVGFSVVTVSGVFTIT
jgi:hypothetical protein